MNSKHSHNSLHTRMVDGVICNVPNCTDEIKTGSPHWYVSFNSHDISIYDCVTTALVLDRWNTF